MRLILSAKEGDENMQAVRRGEVSVVSEGAGSRERGGSEDQNFVI